MTSPERRSLEFPYLFDEFCCLSSGLLLSGFYGKLCSASQHTQALTMLSCAAGDGMPRVHPCMLGHVIVHFFPIQLETFIRRRRVVTWSRPRTKILPAASRGQRLLTQHDFSWLLVHLEF